MPRRKAAQRLCTGANTPHRCRAVTAHGQAPRPKPDFVRSSNCCGDSCNRTPYLAGTANNFSADRVPGSQCGRRGYGSRRRCRRGPLESGRHPPGPGFWRSGHRCSGCISWNDLVRDQGRAVHRGLGRLESGCSGGDLTRGGTNQRAPMSPGSNSSRANSTPVCHIGTLTRVISQPRERRSR